MCIYLPGMLHNHDARATLNIHVRSETWIRKELS